MHNSKASNLLKHKSNHGKDEYVYIHQGIIQNDVMQVAGEGFHFCDIMYEVLSKTVILAWQRGAG